jgi:hypothetical protein
MAIVIDNKKYLIDSPEAFRDQVEKRVTAYVSLLEDQHQEQEDLLI